MLKHDRHEYNFATSLTFPCIAVVLEEPELMTAECQSRRGKLLGSRINNNPNQKAYRKDRMIRQDRYY